MNQSTVSASARDEIDPAAYPDLFGTTDWIIVQVCFGLNLDGMRDGQVASVNVAPRVGNRWVVVQLPNGDWSIPGGTREPNEQIEETARREAFEEAGAELTNLRFFGAWRCESTQPKPHRPHVPHPVFYRLVGIGDASIVGEPLNPPDGERIRQVAVVSLDEAVQMLRDSQRADLADLYRLAARFAG